MEITLTLNEAEMRRLRNVLMDARFALESVAHLQGKERQLLPIADELKLVIGRIEGVFMRNDCLPDSRLPIEHRECLGLAPSKGTVAHTGPHQK